MTRGMFPKAYLRLDPNVDQQHPDSLADFIRLLCAGARQSHRGRFSSRSILETLFGKAAVRRLYERRDVADQADGRVEIIGWDLWQEGDLTVGERMQRLRSKPAPTHPDPSQDRNSAVNEPLPSRISPSEALGVRRKALKVPVVDDREADAWRDFGPEWDAFKEAWIGHGLRLPPTGAKDDENTQRATLLEVLRDRPTDTVEWIRKAPGSTSFDVVAYVLKQRNRIRAQVAT